MDFLVLLVLHQCIIAGKQGNAEPARSLHCTKAGRGDCTIQLGLAFGKRCEQGRAGCGKHKPLALRKQ
jgi:hypothetical protein